MVTKLVLEDGTYLVPHEIPEGDREYEKALLEASKYDKAYKDAKHKPFIDTVRHNARTFRALLVPSTKEEYDEFTHKEDREQKKEAYYKRCPISDGRGKLKQCPKRIPNPDYGKVPDATQTIVNRCEVCPVYRAWENKSKFISLEKMIFNDDGEEIDHVELSTGMISRGDLIGRIRDILLDVVVDKHSHYAEIVKKMLYENMNINKACEVLETNKSSVYKALSSKSMQADVLEAFANEPLVDIIKLLF